MLAYTRRTTTWGKGGGEYFSPLYYFSFLLKIFAINGLNEERARCLNRQSVSPRKNILPFFKTFENTPRNATIFPYPLSRLLIISPVLSRNLADDNFYVRVLFATLKFQLDSTNELTAAERRTYDLHRGLVVLFPHRGDLKILPLVLSFDFLFSHSSFVEGSMSALISTAF